MRNIARTVHSGTGSQGPSGARAAVAYAGDREKVFRERTKAQRSSSGASRWPPVRIRFVHHWIAQSGRASVEHRESRVESRPNQTVKSGPRAQARTRKRPVRVPLHRNASRCRWIRSGDVAGPPPSKRAGLQWIGIARTAMPATAGCPKGTARRLRGIDVRAFPPFQLGVEDFSPDPRTSAGSPPTKSNVSKRETDPSRRKRIGPPGPTRRVTHVLEQENRDRRRRARPLLYRNRQFECVLEPGVHRMFDPLTRIEVRTYNIACAGVRRPRRGRADRAPRRAAGETFVFADIGADEVGLWCRRTASWRTCWRRVRVACIGAGW